MKTISNQFARVAKTVNHRYSPIESVLQTEKNRQLSSLTSIYAKVGSVYKVRHHLK